MMKKYLYEPKHLIKINEKLKKYNENKPLFRKLISLMRKIGR